MKLNRIEESEAILIEGLKLNPNCKERLMSYANFLSDIGRHDEAAELYRKTI
jgi:tetratricopeptide (TPR) repeat protein